MHRYNYSLCNALRTYVGCNDLEEVLGTLIEGAVSFPDPVVRKFLVQ